MAVAVEVLPRLLAGIDERDMNELTEHLDVHGVLPAHAAHELIGLTEASGLRGHGGAAFPVAIKMRAVASRRRRPPVVLANGAEGEPASKKDRVLLRRLPHLVLDGAAVAARAVGAREAIIAVPAGAEDSVRSLRAAVAERGAARLHGEPSYVLVEIEERYISGQETALVDAVNGGPGKPTFTPPRPFERGVRRRPTLVQNVETLAHLALIARHGAEWFRELGTARDPGSALVTVSGAVTAPGVYEIEHGMPLADLLDLARAEPDLRAVLLGGYSGTWIAARDAARAHLSGEDLAAYGATVGAGVIVALGSGACPVAECNRVAGFLAGESAGQCGPCVHGLDAIAFTLHQLATATAGRDAYRDLDRWLQDVPRRGACQHPDGAVRFVESALRVFGEEFADHARRGACPACRRHPVLPSPHRNVWPGR